MITSLIAEEVKNLSEAYNANCRTIFNQIRYPGKGGDWNTGLKIQLLCKAESDYKLWTSCLAAAINYKNAVELEEKAKAKLETLKKAVHLKEQ